MKNMHALALCAILTPAFALATGSAIAQEPRTTAKKEQVQAEAQRQNPQYTEREQAQRQKRTGHNLFLSNKPARGLHADQLIGSNVKGQADGDDIGTINDLIIDENGQVVAVIVGVGGFLGMGERDVAIEWDALQRTAKLDEDEGYDYRFASTKDSLKNAPTYKRY